MDTRTPRLILIARVSDVEQRSALPAQEMRLKAYAEELNLPYELHSFDESAFGDTREEFAKLVADIQRSKEYCWVAFDKCDRLSRNQSQEEVRVLRRLVEAGRIELHFPNDGRLIINRNSAATEWFHLGINLELAQYYSRAISDNVRRKFNQLVNEGYWPHTAPLGYLNIRVDDKHTTIKRDPAKAHFIAKAFDLRAGGMPYDAIAQQLKDEGFRSRGGLVLGKSYIEKIINNPFYFGQMRFKGHLYSHRYEPLISRALFNKCQEVKLQRAHDMTKYNSGEFTFKQLPKCGRCGRAISSYFGRKNVYLRCAGSGQQSCGNPNVAEALLLPGIEDDLANIQIPEEMLKQVVAGLRDRHDNQQVYYADAIAANRREYDGLKRKLSILYEDRLEGRISAEKYDELASGLEARQQELVDALGNLTADNKSFQVTESYLLDLCQRAVDLFRRSNPALRQQLLSFMLSNIELNDKKLSYELTHPFKEIAEANKKGSLEPNSRKWQESQFWNQTLEESLDLDISQEIAEILMGA